MSKLGSRRKAWGYIKKAPCCGNCAQFVAPLIKLTTNSQTIRTSSICRAGEFAVDPKALCSKWCARPPTPARNA